MNKGFTPFQKVLIIYVSYIKDGEKKLSDEYMTGKEIVNLIHKLEKEGMTAEKIIEIIKYIETADPQKP